MNLSVSSIADPKIRSIYDLSTRAFRTQKITGKNKIRVGKQQRRRVLDLPTREELIER